MGVRNVLSSDTVTVFLNSYNATAVDIGDIATLTIGSDLVTGINALNSNLSNTNTNIGLLSNINSAIAGTNIVDALNNLNTDINNVNNGLTNNINMVVADVGVLSSLNAAFIGSNRNSTVDALNALMALQTSSTTNITNAVINGTLNVTGLVTLDNDVTLGKNLTITSGLFTSRGIDDNATVNKIQIENTLVTLKTNVAVQGTGVYTGNITAPNFKFSGLIGTIDNGSNEKIAFDSNSISIYADNVQTVDFTSTAVNILKPLNVTGAIVATGDITAFSDKKLKTITGYLPNISNILSNYDITPVYYTWNNTAKEQLNISDDNQKIGFIAQELEKYFPEVVNIDKKSKFKTVNYNAMTAIIWSLLREFNDRLNIIETKI